jgi:hypothetical protein
VRLPPQVSELRGRNSTISDTSSITISAATSTATSGQIAAMMLLSEIPVVALITKSRITGVSSAGAARTGPKAAASPAASTRLHPPPQTP